MPETKHPVALSIEALFDAMGEGFILLSRSVVMNADERKRLTELSGEIERIQGELVEALHTMADPPLTSSGVVGSREHQIAIMSALSDAQEMLGLDPELARGHIDRAKRLLFTTPARQEPGGGIFLPFLCDECGTRCYLAADKVAGSLTGTRPCPYCGDSTRRES